VRGRVRQDVRRHQPKPQHQRNGGLGQRHPAASSQPTQIAPAPVGAPRRTG
jgi:hypothetical protein